MTQIMEEVVKCGVCGKETHVKVMASSSRFGTCDLDTRPPALFPFTMFLQQCEHCGYVDVNISDYHREVSEFVATSEMYETCDGIEPKSTKAQQYIKYALIQAYKQVTTIWEDEESSAKENAFWGFLNAAWACDDEDDKGDAEECRRRCLDLINILIVNTKDQEQKETYLGIKADLLRRTKQFDAVIVEFENKTVKDPYADQVIRFEVELAKGKDEKRYNMNHINSPEKNKL